jgi:hypothetical protein
MMRNQTSLRFADKVIMATPQLSINTFKDRKKTKDFHYTLVLALS